MKIYFRFLNIPASEAYPFQVFVNDKVVFETPVPIPIDKEIQIEPEVELNQEGKFSLTTKIPLKGFDNKIDLEPNKYGPYIYINMNKSLKKVNFKEQKEDTYKVNLDEETDTKVIENVISEEEKNEITIFLHDIKATSKNPFSVFINGDDFFKTLDIPKAVMLIKGSFVKPKKGDHIIEVEFIFKEQIDCKYLGRYNLTQNGNFILITFRENTAKSLQSKDSFKFSVIDGNMELVHTDIKEINFIDEKKQEEIKVIKKLQNEGLLTEEEANKKIEQLCNE